jgi:hypothetical protein
LRHPTAAQHAEDRTPTRRRPRPRSEARGRDQRPWVDELQRITEAALGAATPIRLDLSDVSFVDRAGVVLLSRLAERDVTLVNCSAFVTELLRGRP